MADTGYKDFLYTGATAPTGQKPQSKLWNTDGIWWGVMFNKTSGKFEIHRLNWATQTWATTGTMVDSRSKSSADALWDGSKLYTVSAVPPGTVGDVDIKVMRFSYNTLTKAYSVDSGFPVVLMNVAVETVVMDKDSAGTLWATYTDSNSSGGRNVLVTHSTTSDLIWLSPYVIPTTGANNLTSDDISTLVAYSGKIGVMWSNQNDNSVYFASHTDGALDSTWSLNPALQGPSYADDHMNIKSLQADSSGQVYAAVKTSLNDVLPSTSNEPLILLLELDNNGSWSRRTVARVSDNNTRPITLLDVENREVYVFMTYQYETQTSGAIYYKKASLDDKGLQFPQGLGTPFIEFTTDTHINNISSTKQQLNGTTNLVAIAGDDNSRYYFHNVIDLPNSGPTATPTNTSVPPTATDILTNTPVPPTATDTPTNTPVLPTATYTLTPTSTPTNTPVPPTATSTPTNTPVPPTATYTLTQTNTPTNTPVPPTATNTPIPPTATSTPTNTPVPPTATYTLTQTSTPTNTPVPPTATNTPTNTPIPPTATSTPTNTLVPPTATYTLTQTSTPTNTPVPPTATNTPTNTPVPPTATNTPTTQNEYILTINKIGSGTITPTAATYYHYGDTVQLTATADAGWMFTGWSGICTGTGVCNITMNADKSVTANFKLVPQERVKNGGFNTYIRTSKIPTYWKAVNFSATDGKFTTAKKEGTASDKITGVTGKTKTLTQTLAFSGLAGDTFNFSFWAKGTFIPTAGACKAQVMLYNVSNLVTTQTVNCKTGTYTAFQQQKSQPFTATGAYTKVVIKLTYSKASGTVWFDGVSLMR